MFSRRRKILQNVIGDIYCLTYPNENCVFLSTNRTSSFHDRRKLKACFQVLNILFRDRKPTNMLFGDDGTHCFAGKTSLDYEKRKPSTLLKKFLHQLQSATLESVTKRQTSHHFVIFVSTPHWSVSLNKNSVPFSSFTLSFHSKTTSISRSLTTVSISFSTLDQLPFSDCKRSCPGNDKKFPRIFSGSLEPVAVCKRRAFGQSSSASFSYNQQTRALGKPG